MKKLKGAILGCALTFPILSGCLLPKTTTTSILSSPSGPHEEELMIANSAPLAQAPLFYRCYSDLTGMRPALNNPLLQQVRAGQLTAVQACIEVLQKADFVNGSQSTLTPAQKAQVTPNASVMNPVPYAPRVVQDPSGAVDPEGVAVLNTFYNFHRSWFPVQDFSAAPAPAMSNNYAARFNDPEEPALYITRTLFENNGAFNATCSDNGNSPCVPYSDIVTGSYSVRGIRSLGPWAFNPFNAGQSAASVGLQIAGTGLERGTLWGISAYNESANTSWYGDDGSVTASGTSLCRGGGGGMSYNTDLNFNLGNAADVAGNFNGGPCLNPLPQRSYGGGILGLQSYLMMNSGFPATIVGGDDDTTNVTEANAARSNASRRMMRRWARNSMQSLICRQAPVVRETDMNAIAANYVSYYSNPANASQVPLGMLPFRTSSSCLACHGALDPMAATARFAIFLSAGHVNGIATGSGYDEYNGNCNGTTNSSCNSSCDPTNPNGVCVYNGNVLVPAVVPFASLLNNGAGAQAASLNQVTFASQAAVIQATPTLTVPSPTPCPSTPESPPNGEYNMMAHDSCYAFRPDQGDLRYRSYDGSLVWQHIAANGSMDGLGNLGNAMAQTNDLYVCAASRYLQFFTGVQVNLEDPGDPNNPPLSAQDAYYRGIAIQMGTHLKQTQNLQLLIQDILNSPLYQSQSMRGVSQ